jgi:hypothetical protein
VKTSDEWRTAAISSTCEVVTGKNAKGAWDFCDLPTERAYPAMGGGWMALCLKHGLEYPEAPHINDLITSGETFA